MTDILKQSETDFEKAWEQFGEEHTNIPISRRTARFFFFAGAQAGIEAMKVLEEKHLGVPRTMEVTDVKA